jgi:hypothetical protein
MRIRNQKHCWCCIYQYPYLLKNDLFSIDCEGRTVLSVAAAEGSAPIVKVSNMSFALWIFVRIRNDPDPKLKRIRCLKPIYEAQKKIV